MKATDELKNEHEGIKLMLLVMQSAAKKMKRGESVNANHLDGIMEFLTIFVDKCHHGKEEEFLFPAMEASGLPREGGPIELMLIEHEQGRQIIARLKGALAGYQSGADTGAKNLEPIIKEYVDLLTQHIIKENNILFPLAEAQLDAERDAELFEAFERLERERIGAGKHEEFHTLLDQLQQEYLA